MAALRAIAHFFGSPSQALEHADLAGQQQAMLDRFVGLRQQREVDTRVSGGTSTIRSHKAQSSAGLRKATQMTGQAGTSNSDGVLSYRGLIHVHEEGDTTAVPRPGYCNQTAAGADHHGINSSCIVNSQGELPLPMVPLANWSTLEIACSARCFTCANCRYISLSRHPQRCSWFKRCSRLSEGMRNFRSILVREDVAAGAKGMLAWFPWTRFTPGPRLFAPVGNATAVGTDQRLIPVEAEPRPLVPPPGKCISTDVPTSCRVTFGPTKRLRDAWIVSTSTLRYRVAARLLSEAGFRPRHFWALSQNDTSVLELWRSFAQTNYHHDPRGAISLTLSHAALWSTFPTTQDWLYVFEDDAIIATTSSPAHVQCMLDSAERMADRRGSAMIYAGLSSADFPERQHHDSLREAVPVTSVYCSHGPMSSAAPATMHARLCAGLGLHAYAVRRGPAQTMWIRLRRFVQDNGGFKRGPLMWFNADVNLRFYYQQALMRHSLTWQTWPVCLMRERGSRVDSKGVRHSGGDRAGLFWQNVTMKALPGAVAGHGEVAQHTIAQALRETLKRRQWLIASKNLKNTKMGFRQTRNRSNGTSST